MENFLNGVKDLGLVWTGVKFCTYMELSVKQLINVSLISVMWSLLCKDLGDFHVCFSCYMEHKVKFFVFLLEFFQAFYLSFGVF